MFDFLSALLAIPSLMSDSGAKTSAPYLKQQKQMADQQANIANALTNNQNPMYQNLYGQYKQQGQNDMAEVIAEAQRQNRSGSRMGRTPLLDPERGGENFFRSLMKGYQETGAQADTQTRNALGQALNGGRMAQSGFNDLSQYGGMANAQKLQPYKTVASLFQDGNSSKLNNTGLWPAQEENDSLDALLKGYR